MFEGGMRWSADTNQVHSDSGQSKRKAPFQVDRYEDLRRQ
jgi:hypothetical protein